MNSGATSERVYDELKRRILAHDFRPGDRLDAAMLGDTLNSSVTPVRDALHVLTGEGLVATRTSDGFHLPAIDAPSLEDLYAWNAQALDIATKTWRAPPFADLRLAIAEPADHAGALFLAIASRSRNAEHARAVAALNDRLHATRMIETAVLDGIEEELAALLDLIITGDQRLLRRAITAYHRRRRRHVADLVRALYRA